jgi:hypothetical protein
MENLSTSVASERLVEIIKGLSKFLNTKSDDPKIEGRRKSALQFMAVVASIVTALLCQPALTRVVPETWSTFPGILALGLLASGGSGFWNSIMTYVLRLKDVQSAAADTAEKALKAPSPAPGPIALRAKTGT